MAIKKLSKILILALLLVSFMNCSQDDKSATILNYTITIGAFILNNGIYTATENELIFNSQQVCQTWSRTAQGDIHNSNTHLHYNAASDVSYNNNTITFSWTEYGPELDQASIEISCSNETNGVNKTVDDTNYYQDKPNLYLKIIQVQKN